MSLGRDDVVRSVRHYLAGMLPFPWEIDLERAEIRDSERPAGLIEVGDVEARGVRTAVPQAQYVKVVPVTIVLYPSLPSGTGGPRMAGHTARRLADALERVFNLGADGYTLAPTTDVDGNALPGRPASGPLRLPLWDFGEVPIVGTPAERAAPEFPVAVLWIESLATNAVADDVDPRRWTVIAELRVSWEDSGAAGPVGPTTTGVAGSFVPSS